MSEKRKPEIVFVAVIFGNTEPKSKPSRNKIELFHASQWSDIRCRGADQYRIRCNGRWFNGKHVYTLSQVTNLMRRSVADVRKKRRLNAKKKTGAHSPPLGQT